MGESIIECVPWECLSSIDEIQYSESRSRQECVIGGAGTYAAMGARLVAGREHSSSVGWIVDMGSDFPIDFREMIDSWHTSCFFREDQSRATTRAWNGYGPGDHRAFRYLTPKMRLDHNSLPAQLLRAQTFHLVCSPERCIDLVHGILDGRTILQSNKGTGDRKPLIIWEPVPDLCLPEHLEAFRRATQQVDVVSPNSQELLSFFPGELKCQAHAAAEVVGWGIGTNSEGALVVREGKHGCSVFSKDTQFSLRAYHTLAEKSQSMVVDPTGGGNAFLGALAMALSSDSHTRTINAIQALALDESLTTETLLEIEMAAIHATVAASFVIEQPGMPEHRVRADGTETWNGESFGARLRTYLNREKLHLTMQKR